ncbi:MAG TPA: MoxR family ATPase [Acidimicrobiales bacterium]
MSIPSHDNNDPFAWFARSFRAIQENVELVIHGKADVVRLALVCLLAEGHLLVEDVPGVGKTSLARSLASSIGASWHRIQFTPDLLPSDVTGVTIYNQHSGTFEFKPGPVFANIVLADEINRASPKTQSALLEVMEEHHVTVDGVAHPVPRPFMVVATQNPVDMDGTYQLPEAQLDRFLIRISVGYPDQAAEVDILRSHHAGAAVDQISHVVGNDHVRTMIAITNEVHVADAVHDYIVRLVAATRHRPEVRLGASPRGSLALLRAGRASAAADGRNYLLPEDVRALVGPVLAHRLILTPEAEVRGVTAEQVVDMVLAETPVPRTAVA